MRKTLLLMLILIFLPVGVLADECKSESHPWQKARVAGFFGPEEDSPLQTVVAPNTDGNSATPEFYAAWPQGIRPVKLNAAFNQGCDNLVCRECGTCINKGALKYIGTGTGAITGNPVDVYYVLIDCQCVGECAVPGLDDIMGGKEDSSGF